MGERRKDQYCYASLYQVAMDIKAVYGDFQVEEFLTSTQTDQWEELELKARLVQISKNLGKYLPPLYSEAIEIIHQVVMKYDDWGSEFGGFFPVFVELFGQKEEDWDTSMKALAYFTRYASSEFAVRSFLLHNETKMIAQMRVWSKSEDEHIRRLSCEGSRPMLPWGQALTSFQQDPTPTLSILEQLKQDPSLYVRKSVANHLNDISKTHPQIVIEIAKRWYAHCKETDWIVEHGCRTLLKQGNQDVLELLGYDNATEISVEDIVLHPNVIHIGECIMFSFRVYAHQATKVRIEYGIDFVKSNGKRRRKIFQISKCKLDAHERRSFMKKHAFCDVSVRKHYAGIHAITLIINGREQGTIEFAVT